MKRTWKLAGAGLVLAAVAAWAAPQYRTAREAALESMDNSALPNWTNPEPFERDVFTFARVKYHVDGQHGRGHD